MDPSPGPPKVRSWDVALSAFELLAIIVVGSMIVAPKFEEMFRQVKVPMPGLTLQVMSLSSVICAMPPILVAFLMTVIPASFQFLSPRGVSIARVVVPILKLCVLVGFVYALYLPLGCMGCGGIGPPRGVTRSP